MSILDNLRKFYVILRDFTAFYCKILQLDETNRMVYINLNYKNHETQKILSFWVWI